MNKKSCTSIIKDNVVLLSAHISAKFRDDLLIGTEHSYKVSPECKTPNESFLRANSQSIEVKNENDKELSDEEKKEIVLADPKFGMFSLFKYHLKRGYKNEILKKKNAIYCSHIFSLLGILPLVIFAAKWSIYIALVSEQSYDYEIKTEWCPMEKSWRHKLIMFGVCALYFTKSFFLWDNLTDRTRLNKMIPHTDTWTMIDTFQEFGFNLFVYGANIWIIYHSDLVEDVVMDCLAIEFLMNLDNEFESIYFDYLPESAVDIYDNVFVTYKENYDLLEKKNKECSFCCLHFMTFIPFKILLLTLLVFPIFCLFMMVYAPICI